MYIYLLSSFIIIICYKYFVTNNTKNFIKSKYNIISNRCIFLYSIVRLFIIVLWFKFNQTYTWKNVKPISKNIYELTFEINRKLYKVRLKIKEEPSKILQIIDKNNIDVTTIFEPYVNFQNLSIKNITPLDLDHDNLHLELYDGTSKKINKNEIINL